MGINKNTIYVCVLLAIGIIGFYVAWDFTADDSYITFRYSQHLSEGYGPIFNIDDADPVEGYTNFLWMIIMVIPHACGWNPVIFSKLFGILCYGGCALILYLYAHRKTRNSFWGICAMLPFVLLPSSYFHTVSGMETILYVVILLSVFVVGYEVMTSGETTGGRQLLLFPVLVLLLGMTRPEGLLPGMVTWVTVLLCLPRRRRVRFLIYSAGLLLLPGLVYFIWRMVYFGWLLPNTFYVKFGQPFDGLEWSARSLASLVGILAIGVLSHTLIRARSRDNAKIRIYYIVFLIMAVLPYTMSNLMMNYMSRFLFHVLPVIFLIFVLEIHTIYKRAESNKKGADFGLWAVLLIVCISIFPLLHNDKTEVARLALYESHLENAHLALARSLKQSSVPPHLRTLAVGDAGAIPYYSEWTSYDFVGLNDEFVAHNPAAKSEYIKAKKPTMLILYSHDGKQINSYQFGFKPATMISDYNNVGYIRWFPDYYLGIFIRKDLDAAYYDELAVSVNDVRQRAERLNVDADNRAGLLRHLKAKLGR